MHSALIDHCRLDPRRPWPGVGLDPSDRSAALATMAGGRTMVQLNGRAPVSEGAGLASLCHVSPASLTCSTSEVAVLDEARGAVHMGGLVVVEEPGRPFSAPPEPLMVGSDQVLLWSAAGGVIHDLRVTRFTNSGAAVERFECEPLDADDLVMSARAVGLAHEGSWGSWRLDTPPAEWIVMAFRRNG